MMARVFVVSTNAVTDIAGELLDSGEVVAAFDSLEKAYAYIDSVEETYLHKRCDYDVTELDIR